MELGNRRRIGSVKAAVNFYDDKIADTDSPSLKKTQMDALVPSLRTRELHRGQKEIRRYKDSKWTAESAKAQAESELSTAKKTVKHLSSMIEETNNKAKAQMRDIETPEKRRKPQHAPLVARNENYEYARVMRELEYVKNELFKLKLDVASVLKEKFQAEKEIEASSSKTLSCSRTAEVLRKEIEEANEEQVLAELARIEALKELGDIESQRQKEAKEYASKLESTRIKLKEANEAVDESKEVEMKLVVTMSDADLLRNELNLVKEIEKKVQGHDDDGSMKRQLEESTIREELEAANKELALIREEGFQFMASMDVIRNELKHVTTETIGLKKEEAKTESTIQNINSKLLRAKAKLEVVSASEEKAKSIVISLSHTLDNLKTERDATKRENELISQEIATTKEEIQKAEFEIATNEERLQDAMQVLEVVKTSEAIALEKLEAITETTMRKRALAAQNSSVITISKFEYEYLTNHAAVAEKIADKKVAAAKAWIEALKASEKEILTKTKIAQRELKETKLEEEIYTKRNSLVARRGSGEELENWPRKRKSSSKNMDRALPRKSIKSNGSITPASRIMKFQKPDDSSAVRHVSPFPIKKRKKVIPNLAKFFRGKKITKTT